MRSIFEPAKMKDQQPSKESSKFLLWYEESHKNEQCGTGKRWHNCRNIFVLLNIIVYYDIEIEISGFQRFVGKNLNCKKKFCSNRIILMTFIISIDK